MSALDLQQGSSGLAAGRRALLHQAERFLSWWAGELIGLVPERWRRALAAGRSVLLVEPRGDDFAVTLLRGGQRRDLGTIGQGGTRDASTLMRFAKGRSHDRTAVTLRLPEDRVLRRRLAFPAGAEGALRQALRFQIGQETPFAVDQVLYDYHVVERSTDGARLTVELVLAPRDAVEAMLARCKDHGLVPGIVDVATIAAEPSRPINLLSGGEEKRSKRSRSRINALLALCAAASVAAAVFLPLEQRRAASEALQLHLERARADAETVSRLRDEVERLVKEDRFLAERRQGRPTVVEILDELTRLLPDHTWLSALDLRDGQLRSAGSSTAAASLIGLIEDSPRFRAPRSASPITRDREAGLERFNFTFGLQGRENNG